MADEISPIFAGVDWGKPCSTNVTRVWRPTKTEARPSGTTPEEEQGVEAAIKMFSDLLEKELTRDILFGFGVIETTARDVPPELPAGDTQKASCNGGGVFV